tara:strand:- start:559 stop:1725 length:1167 start_codon:yes stop_codon:yes gene_type:complete
MYFALLRKFFLTVFFTLTWILGASDAFSKSQCQIVYDAGSSGTRLYVYEKKNNTWIEHEGPKGSALADPVREIRGAKWSQRKELINEIMSLLDTILQDGPKYSSGGLAWKAFDWKKVCDVRIASIFATAGMRIAEHVNRKRSQTLWRDLKLALQKKLGSKVKVLTRTLPGYEEGLFAWLSVREKKGSDRFGIVEMGGASSQITFPCPKCVDSKNIWIGGKNLKIFSYSFLGLGGDEASKVFGLASSCKYGAGVGSSGWNSKKCADSMKVSTPRGIYDPYNFRNGKRGIYKRLPFQKAGGIEWVFTGAFKFVNEKTIDKCCRNRGKCFEKETSCFRAVYYKRYIEALGLDYKSKRAGASWTLGAAICNENDCLKRFGRKQCLWSSKGCL